jgi:hypothetical protein
MAGRSVAERDPFGQLASRSSIRRLSLGPGGWEASQLGVRLAARPFSPTLQAGGRGTLAGVGPGAHPGDAAAPVDAPFRPHS